MATDIHRMFAEAFPQGPVRKYAWLLSQQLEQGNVCIPVGLQGESVAGYPYGAGPLPEISATDPFFGEPDGPLDRPFIVDGGNVYFQRYYKYETEIVRMLRRKAASGREAMAARQKAIEAHRELVRSLTATFPKQGLSRQEVVDWQLVAALQTLLRDFSILTGGPGTGKTTTLAKILRIYYALEPGARVALAAPTGKAAMRMHESLKRSAEAFPEDVRARIGSLTPSTLHKLLGFMKDTVKFRHDADNPLPYDLVIVDEASMVDLPMFAKLLSALGEQGRLVLLGDKDQLASVEAGSLLGDLCRSATALNAFTAEQREWTNGFIPDAERAIPSDAAGPDGSLLSDAIFELRLSHRFKAQEGIGRLGRAIIGGDGPAVADMQEGTPSSRVSFDTAYDEQVLAEFVEGYRAYVSEPDVRKALQRLNDLRVLVTVKEGPRGLHALVRRIEELLQRKSLLKPKAGFYLNRPVIVTRNNYELKLYNGDIGIVRPGEDGRLRVWFEDAEGGVRSVVPAYLSHCETVFAMTIHKSQGSEFGKVLVVLPEGTDSPLLTRELIYTAVTRAKESVVVQGARETLLHAVGRRVNRISGIGARLTPGGD